MYALERFTFVIRKQIAEHRINQSFDINTYLSNISNNFF